MSLSTQPRTLPTGQHRRPAAVEPDRPMRLVLSGLGGLIMAAICGLTAFVIIADARHDHGGAASAAAPAPVPSDVHDIGSRSADARPLSLEEVFPDTELKVQPNAAPYRIGISHIDTDCATATTGTMGWVIDDRGCSQVVRAYLTAPYGGYEVTAGLFNLADASDADRLAEQAGRHVEAGDGSFAAMGAGVPGESVPALSQVGWQSRGHFLVFCVITRPDGKLVGDADPYAQRITSDLIGSYLEGTVIGRRASSP